MWFSVAEPVAVLVSVAAVTVTACAAHMVASNVNTVGIAVIRAFVLLTTTVTVTGSVGCALVCTVYVPADPSSSRARASGSTRSAPVALSTVTRTAAAVVTGPYPLTVCVTSTDLSDITVPPVTVTACGVCHVFAVNTSVRLPGLPADPTATSASGLVAVTVTGPAGWAANRTVYVLRAPPCTVTARRLMTTPASSSVTVTVTVTSGAAPV